MGELESGGSGVKKVKAEGISVTFWGVRGGLPVPGPETVEFGGNTTCLEVRAGSHLIIIDAGTGIIPLGAKLEAERAETGRAIAGTLLFTHGHHDHTQGLSCFAPFGFGDSCFHVLGPQVFGLDLWEVLRRAMFPSMHPTPCDRLHGMRSIRHVREDQTIVLLQPGVAPVVQDTASGQPFVPPGAVCIRIYHSCHHPRGGSLIYSIEYHANGERLADERRPADGRCTGTKLVFATDTEGYEGGDQRLVRLARGADLLIHDAEYVDSEYTGPVCRQGWGHSTWRMAVDVGQQAQVKRLALTHHHAQHDDAFMREMEQRAQTLFPQAFIAREGMTLTL